MAAPEADFSGLIESMSIFLMQRKLPLAAKLSGEWRLRGKWN
ncbi:hypothetical protein VCRLGP8_90002 [Vibrio crassostreae]|nr:hypothetical protein VCRLGP8_90002 [Vibrio crassostreae]